MPGQRFPPSLWAHRLRGCSRPHEPPPRKENTALLPAPRVGKSCWTRKYGARTLTANKRSKSWGVISSMRASLVTHASGANLTLGTRRFGPVRHPESTEAEGRYY